MPVCNFNRFTKITTRDTKLKHEGHNESFLAFVNTVVPFAVKV